MAGLKRRVFLSYQDDSLGALGSLGLVEDPFNAEVLANKNPRKSTTVAGVEVFQIASRAACFASGLAIVFGDDWISDPCEECAEDWCYPEEPDLLNGPHVSAGQAQDGSRSKAASWVYREVGHGDADQVDQGQPQADGDGSEACRSALIGRTEDDEQEEEGQNDFGDESGSHAVVSWGVIIVAVASEAAFDEAEARVALSDVIERVSAEESAYDLSDDVWHKVFRWKTLRDHQADGDSWVQVAAGDMTDCVSHG